MKFAKELERELVPEWRLKYLDYRAGKKKLKAIQRALRAVNQTPRLRRRGVGAFGSSPDNATPQYDFLNRTDLDGSEALGTLALGKSASSLRSKLNAGSSSEEEPLNSVQHLQIPGATRYGSIERAPSPHAGDVHDERGRAPPSLKLPGAALDAEQPSPLPGPSAADVTHGAKPKSVRLPPATENALEIGTKSSAHHRSSSLPFRYRSLLNPKRMNSSSTIQQVEDSRPLYKRVFSLNGKPGPPTPGDVPLEAYRDLDMRQADFFHFLDLELEKIETFYMQKEEEATERLQILREQLHTMRDRRLHELVARQAAKNRAREKKKTAASEGLLKGPLTGSDDERGQSGSRGAILKQAWLNPIDAALRAVKSGKYGKSTKAMAALATPAALLPQHPSESHRDFVRRPEAHDVPYQTARKKLKIALQEYYRGLELLKSYALLNRTAFRKINKKYDKTVNARPTMRYMAEKVDKAYFVQSDVLEGHIRTVEDLYARYFEKGNHKVAIGKLRIKMARAGDYTEHAFRNGLTLAAGLVLGIQGLVYAFELLHSPKYRTNTSFLMQLYGGYFLMNLLFLLFCLACRVWHRSKINYVFVFEFDTRHHLDWRQLSELPCFCFFLLGLFMFLNFNEIGGDAMYHWYPLILVTVTASLLFLPLPILYFRSRQWLLYSMWRLILAGLYPVEFRDFFMGDMFCSLTYAMGNVALFFCLYGNDWGSPPQCNSNHSRAIGVLTAIPSVWRALQCIRRYWDTGDVFPHLANCGKYVAGVVFYMTLSIYRITKDDTNRAVFITFAIINSIYTSIWDVVMDWSLGDPYAKNKFLRPTLGYKRVWPYYVAMITDPILRFSWIPYASIPIQLQHSGITSFLVSLSEIFRRGMWTLFRVENEHCTNVGLFRAAKDVPLPYDIPTPEEETEEQRIHRHPQVADHIPQVFDRHGRYYHDQRPGTAPLPGAPLSHAQTFASPAEVEEQRLRQRTRSSIRRRANSEPEVVVTLTRGLSRVGTILRDAHAKDFERKRKPEVGRSQSGRSSFRYPASGPEESEDDEEDDDDDDDEDIGRGRRSGATSRDEDEMAAADLAERGAAGSAGESSRTANGSADRQGSS
ncbi:EXS-domain-containing protein [Westerdykella ornata]|uniref:EXS-domain-containing protein n=1 Tax=Westerdykella ornata TaxID=318751 RepID=A0A6A6JIH9_WESOR|nr:EXS-domain-containing protein [Westerdykella ornata]KAF2276450.1 EXS-domain-containing protein [Westerdykella ornata]